MAGALLVNLVIFAGAPFLLRLNGDHDSSPAVEQMVFLTPPPPLPDEPPPEEKPPPPQKPPAPSSQPLETVRMIPRLEAPPLELTAGLTLTPMAIPEPQGSLSHGELGRPDTMPMPLAQVHPSYPYSARRRGVQGWVLVRILVSKAGEVSQVKVLKSRPKGVFEDTVRRTLRSWRFKPAMKDGQPMAAWVQTTIRFKLSR